MPDLRTYVIQCRDCNEDVVFRQLINTTEGRETLRAVQLRCGVCCTTHVYAPIEFMPWCD